MGVVAVIDQEWVGGYPPCLSFDNRFTTPNKKFHATLPEGHIFLNHIVRFLLINYKKVKVPIHRGFRGFYGTVGLSDYL